MGGDKFAYWFELIIYLLNLVRSLVSVHSELKRNPVEFRSCVCSCKGFKSAHHYHC